ncbi:hypothetical protein ACGVWS_13990 [Enterobacteriaceae bacterium LUAb1]
MNDADITINDAAEMNLTTQNGMSLYYPMLISLNGGQEGKVPTLKFTTLDKNTAAINFLDNKNKTGLINFSSNSKGIFHINVTPDQASSLGVRELFKSKLLAIDGVPVDDSAMFEFKTQYGTNSNAAWIIVQKI